MVNTDDTTLCSAEVRHSHTLLGGVAWLCFRTFTDEVRGALLSAAAVVEDYATMLSSASRS